MTDTFYVKDTSPNPNFVASTFLTDSFGRPVLASNPENANYRIYDSSGNQIGTNTNNYIIVPQDFNIRTFQNLGFTTQNFINAIDPDGYSQAAGLLTFADAFRPGGTYDVQTHYNGTSGYNVPAYREAASYALGVAGQTSGFSTDALELGGGLVNRIQNFLGNAPEADGKYYNNSRNVNAIEKGFNDQSSGMYQYDRQNLENLDAINNADDIYYVNLQQIDNEPDGSINNIELKYDKPSGASQLNIDRNGQSSYYEMNKNNITYASLDDGRDIKTTFNSDGNTNAILAGQINNYENNKNISSLYLYQDNNYEEFITSGDQVIYLDNGYKLNISDNLINNQITGDNSTVNVGNNSSLNVNGSGDYINITSDDYISILGQDQTVSGVGGNDRLTIGGNGQNASTEMDDHVNFAQGGSLTETDNSRVEVSGNNITDTLGTSDTIGSYGGSDTINVQGGGGNVWIGGNGQNASTEMDNHVNFAQGGSLTEVDNARTEVGGNDVFVSMQSNDTIGAYGGGDTIDVQGGGDNVWIGGDGQNASTDMDDHVNFAQGGTVFETDNTRVEVSGNNVTDTLGTNDTIGSYGFGDTISASGGGDNLWIAGQNEIINGSGETITLMANVQVTINGSNDTINGAAGQDNITINGSGDHFSGNDDDVDFEGNASSDTETGGDNSYFWNGAYIGGTDESGGIDDPGDPEDGDDWDPLVLNLQGGAVQTVDAAHSPARFDFHDTGVAVQTGWGTAGEGYLVDAPDKNTIPGATNLVSSFASLQALDSNHDGKIDASDAHWSDLKVWVDGTGMAAFQSGSLKSLDDLGITSIALAPTPDRHRQNGNMILADGTFTMRDGSTGQIADIDFRTAPGSSNQGQAGAAANLQASTQAAQLVSAMSTFGVTSAADTPTPGLDRPIHIPMGVDATIQPLRHTA